MSVPSSNDARPDNYEMNARLCRFVEKCPFMYDRSHPQYLRKEVCDEAWVRIAKEMGESVFPCRERWRNIRTSFARSINTNKVPSSANRTKPYYLHEELTFLARHITPGVPVRNRKRATSASGEESEHIEVSIGEETFNGFERLCSMSGDNTDTQNGYEAAADVAGGGGERSAGEGGGGGDAEEDRQNSGSNSLNGIDYRRDDEISCNRFVRFPPPPLQAAPHSIIKCDTDEDVSICPPLSKRPCNGGEAYMGSGVENRHHNINADEGFLQELRTELIGMNHSQKIYLKRRIYETLSEIYPFTSTSTSAPHDSVSASTSKERPQQNVASRTPSCNQITLAALQSFEKLCQNLKRETVDCDESDLPQQTLASNGNAESPCIPVSSTATKACETPRNQNEFGVRTRSRPVDRNRLKRLPNGKVVKNTTKMTE